MKTVREIVESFELDLGPGALRALERDLSEFESQVRAEERVKATAEALAQVSRTLGPRSGVGGGD